MEKQYFISDAVYERRKISFIKKASGFIFKPKNRVQYEGIMVNELRLVQPSMIERIIKKKTKRKLDDYLKYMIRIIEEEENPSSTGLRSTLNDLTRYKSIIMGKYRKYLDEKYIMLLLQKISLLEEELKNKLIYIEQYTMIPSIEEPKKSR